jgi:hypothetical protein
MPEHSAPAPAAEPAALPALAPAAGLRVVLDTRGWELAALPGRAVVLDDDFRHLRALDPTDGAELWRIAAQEQPQGRHTLYTLGDRVLLHAGPDVVVVDAEAGAVVGRHPAHGYNGGDGSCRLELLRGLTDVSQRHVALEPDVTACASVCDCSVHLFRCDTGASLTAAFHGNVTHLYTQLDRHHDDVCFHPPRLLGKVRGRTLLALEQDDGEYAGVALDRDGAELWRRPELAAALRRYRAFDGDLAGDVCWSADEHDIRVWTCSSGQVRWRAAFTDKDDGRGADARLVAPDRLLVRRRSPQAVRVELRDLAGGKRLWRRELPAGSLVLVPGEDPRDPLFGPGGAVVWIDPRTGATVHELALAEDQALVADVDGRYLRLGEADSAELDREGRPLRSIARDLRGLVWLGPRFVVAREGPGVVVLRRPDYAVGLTLEGKWSVDETTAALGPDALLLYQHRGAEPLRIALLRATD